MINTPHQKFADLWANASMECRFLALIKLNGLSLRQFALKTRYSVQHWSYSLKHDRLMIGHIQEACRILNVDVATLLAPTVEEREWMNAPMAGTE